MSKEKINCVNVLGLTILKRIDFEYLMIENYELEDANKKIASLCKNQTKEINKLKAKIKELEESAKQQAETPKEQEVTEQTEVAVPKQKKKVYNKQKVKNQQDK